jgi:uncharacterized protein
MAEPRRVARRLIAGMAGGLVALLALVLVYGTAVEPRLVLDERHIEVEVPGLDSAFQGSEVALFSDLQLGMWWDNAGMVERVVDEVVEARPAAVLLAGDFVYGQSPDVATQVDRLRRLLLPIADAGIPAFAVLGNHDYAAGAAEQVTHALKQLSIPVLHNESVEMLQAPGADSVHLVGLAATRPGLTDVDAALADLPAAAPRVVMMHNPTAFPRLGADTAPLAVAGHTHCGQIALPGSPDWSYLGLTQQEKLVVDGFAPPGYGAPGNQLFVTCGIGFSLLPVRIGAPPQLTFVTLDDGTSSPAGAG